MTHCAAVEILSAVVAQQWGAALASYTQVWQLKGVSYADGFAALAAVAAVEIRQ